MKKMTLALLLSTFPCSADEIVLKDGRRITWKSVVDEGDSYNVETRDGKRLTLKRSEVYRFEATAPVDPLPLTGATFTFDRKGKLEVVDLLGKVNLRRDVVAGVWKASGGRLNGVGSGGENGRIQIPHTPVPEEYDLTLAIERKAGVDNIGVGLIGGGNQFMYYFDVDPAFGVFSGILVPAGAGHRRVIETPGEVFPVGKLRTVVFMVRKEAFIVQVDGKDFAAWKPDWSTLSILPQCAVQRKDVLSLSIQKSGFEIHRMTLTSVK